MGEQMSEERCLFSIYSIWPAKHTSILYDMVSKQGWAYGRNILEPYPVIQNLEGLRATGIGDVLLLAVASII